MGLKKPNMGFLEIDITYSCGMMCYNCDRMISEAPGGSYELIILEQIEKLISQSLAIAYPWKRFRVLGGEPTSHPKFKEIITMIMKYKKDYNPNLKVEVSTHGFGAETQNKLDWLHKNYPDIKINNSKKTTNAPVYFNYMNLAPIDRSESLKKHKYKGCWIVRQCGIGLNYSGFYCCGAGGAISRIFGYEAALKDVKDLSASKIQDMYQLLCSKCGHYKPVLVNKKNPGTLLSPVWKNAFDAYRNSKKILERF